MVPSAGQGFDDQCLGVVATHLRKASFAGGEAVYERGERGDEMYLIVDGSVALHAAPRQGTPGFGGRSQAPQQPPEGVGDDGCTTVESAVGERIAGKGDVFGEGGLFPELGLRRRESATALSWVSVYMLNASTLLEIAKEYPEVRRQLGGMVCVSVCVEVGGDSLEYTHDLDHVEIACRRPNHGRIC